MAMLVLYVATPYRFLDGYHSFRGTYCLHIQCSALQTEWPLRRPVSIEFAVSLNGNWPASTPLYGWRSNNDKGRSVLILRYEIKLVGGQKHKEREYFTGMYKNYSLQMEVPRWREGSTRNIQMEYTVHASYLQFLRLYDVEWLKWINNHLEKMWSGTAMASLNNHLDIWPERTNKTTKTLRTAGLWAEI
jgi:hypothetical protein